MMPDFRKHVLDMNFQL
jgi:uncharacterized UBP type Zn finger protein